MHARSGRKKGGEGEGTHTHTRTLTKRREAEGEGSGERTSGTRSYIHRGGGLHTHGERGGAGGHADGEEKKHKWRGWLGNVRGEKGMTHGDFIQVGCWKTKSANFLEVANICGFTFTQLLTSLSVNGITIASKSGVVYPQLTSILQLYNRNSCSNRIVTEKNAGFN